MCGAAQDCLLLLPTALTRRTLQETLCIKSQPGDMLKVEFRSSTAVVMELAPAKAGRQARPPATN